MCIIMCILFEATDDDEQVHYIALLHFPYIRYKYMFGVLNFSMHGTTGFEYIISPIDPSTDEFLETQQQNYAKCLVIVEGFFIIP